MNENEKAVKELEFGESYKLPNGCTFTRVVGGWVYCNQLRNVCYIPDANTAGFEDKIITKEKKAVKK